MKFLAILFVALSSLVLRSMTTDSSFSGSRSSSEDSDAILYMKKLYNEMMIEDHPPPNEEKVYSCEVKGKRVSNVASFFPDISAVGREEQLQRAILRMKFSHGCHHSSATGSFGSKCNLEGILNDHCRAPSASINQPMSASGSSSSRKPFLHKRFTIEANKDMLLDVTDLIRAWRENDQSSSCISLTITTKQHHNRRLIPMILFHLVNPPHRPVLTVYTQDNAPESTELFIPSEHQRHSNRPRSKRQQPSNQHTTSNSKCTLIKHYVNFGSLGLSNRIIAPKGINMNYCSGRCFFPLSANRNHTVHAELQALVHVLDNSSVPPVCCSPTVYQSVVILYYTRNKSIVLKRFYRISVRKCGCS